MADEEVKNILYKLDFDTGGSLKKVDELLGKLRDMEQQGQRAVDVISEKMANLKRTIDATGVSYTKVARATDEVARAEGKVAEARAKNQRTTERANKEAEKGAKDLERARVSAEKEAEKAARAAEKARIDAEKGVARAAKESERARVASEKEVARAAKAAEVARIKAEKAALAEAKAAERERAKAQKEAEREQTKRARAEAAAERERIKALRQIRAIIREIEAEEKKRADRRQVFFDKNSKAAADEHLKGLRQNSAEMMRLIRTFPEARAELNKLATTYGTFTASLGSNSGALTAQEEAVRKLIERYPVLQREAERLATKTGGAVLGRDSQGNDIRSQPGVPIEVSRANFQSPMERFGLNPFEIRQVGYALDRLGVQGAGVASSLGSMFGLAGLAVAGIGLAAGLVIRELIKLGQVGIRIATQFIKDAIEIAASFDSVQASFEGIFHGYETVGLAAMGAVRAESERLGVDVSEIVRRVLPLVSNLADATKFGEYAVGLAVLDPKQGIEGATRVIQDLLAGNLQSLKRTFAIPTSGIEEAQERLGNVQGALEGLGAELKARGLDFEALSDTWVVVVGQIQQYLKFLKADFGEPIVDELIELFKIFETFLRENKDEIRLIFTAIGTSIAEAVDFGTEKIEEFLGTIDREQVLEIAKSFVQFGESLRFLLEVLSGTPSESAFDEFIVFRNVLSLASVAAIALAGSLAFMGAVGAAISQELINRFGLVTTGILTAMGQFEAAGAVLARIGDSPIAAFQNVQSTYNDMFNEFQGRVVAAKAGMDNFSKSMDESDELALQMADALLAIDNSLDQVAAAEKEANEATTERVKKEKELYRELEAHKRKFLFDLAESEIDLANELLDNARDAANARLKAERDYLEDLAKMKRKYDQDVIDAGTDLADKEEDIRRKHELDLIDDEIANAKKRIEIEESYLKRIAELRRKYQFDAEEAIRENDAVALLRLRRKLEFDLNEERIARDDKIDEENESEEDRIAARQRDLERELEDARIAHERKLRDLSIALAREREERRIAKDLELKEINEQEALKRKEIEETHKRQRESDQRQYQFQLQEMKIAGEHALKEFRRIEAEKLKILNDANKLLAQAYAFQASLMAQMRASAVAIAGIFNSPNFQSGGSIGGGPSSPAQIGDIGATDPLGSNGGNRTTRRAWGGPIWAGQPVVVGDPQRPGQPNPEVIMPRQHGYVFPLKDISKLFMMTSRPYQAQHFGAGHGIGRAINAQISLTNPNELSPVQAHIVEKMITKSLSDVYK